MSSSIPVSDRALLMQTLLDIGEAMLLCGAEINRVEDTLTRLGKAYHAQRTDTFVITSSIVLTYVFEDGEICTQTRRISDGYSTDFTKLERFNALSRACCASPMSISTLQKAVKDIVSKQADPIIYIAGNLIAAFAFAIFFNGTVLDGFVSMLLGCIICFFNFRMHRFFPNKVIFLLVSSAVIGSLACFGGRLFPVLNADKIIIGDIMLLIPGIYITNAVRDVLMGDTISGLLKLTESLIWALAIAGGFMTAIALIGA